MKNILILLTVLLLLPLTADGQDKPSFSAREMADVRVATPGLFAKSNHIYLHLDSLQEHEYAFPLPVTFDWSYPQAGHILSLSETWFIQPIQIFIAFPHFRIYLHKLVGV